MCCETKIGRIFYASLENGSVLKKKRKCVVTNREEKEEKILLQAKYVVRAA